MFISHKNRFDYYNKLCFNNELPPIRIDRTHDDSIYGQFLYDDETDVEKALKIEINIDKCLTLSVFDATLLHEMIHYWQLIHKFDMDDEHGVYFHFKAGEIFGKHDISVL